jgi:hypothetical protein
MPASPDSERTITASVTAADDVKWFSVRLYDGTNILVRFWPTIVLSLFFAAAVATCGGDVS